MGSPPRNLQQLTLPWCIAELAWPPFGYECSDRFKSCWLSESFTRMIDVERNDSNGSDAWDASLTSFTDGAVVLKWLVLDLCVMSYFSDFTSELVIPYDSALWWSKGRQSQCEVNTKLPVTLELLSECTAFFMWKVVREVPAIPSASPSSSHVDVDLFNGNVGQ